MPLLLRYPAGEHLRHGPLPPLLPKGRDEMVPQPLLNVDTQVPIARRPERQEDLVGNFMTADVPGDGIPHARPRGLFRSAFQALENLGVLIEGEHAVCYGRVHRGPLGLEEAVRAHGMNLVDRPVVPDVQELPGAVEDPASIHRQLQLKLAIGAPRAVQARLAGVPRHHQQRVAQHLYQDARLGAPRGGEAPRVDPRGHALGLLGEPRLLNLHHRPDPAEELGEEPAWNGAHVDAPPYNELRPLDSASPHPLDLRVRVGGELQREQRGPTGEGDDDIELHHEAKEVVIFRGILVLPHRLQEQSIENSEGLQCFDAAESLVVAPADEAAVVVAHDGADHGLQ
mmetsp:Transcript_20784/g.65777  ORF Transcript_20784/g.65777 Transcript_20784/m.65777 type:complete len:341 (-) Transcript_20784:1992-3014(-)